jgi:hypothetical protein
VFMESRWTDERFSIIPLSDRREVARPWDILESAGASK